MPFSSNSLAWTIFSLTSSVSNVPSSFINCILNSAVNGKPLFTIIENEPFSIISGTERLTSTVSWINILVALNDTGISTCNSEFTP